MTGNDAIDVADDMERLLDVIAVTTTKVALRRRSTITQDQNENHAEWAGDETMNGKERSREQNPMNHGPYAKADAQKRQSC